MKLIVSSFPDGGCNHSLKGRPNELCGGVPGSAEGHIFRFQTGQVATVASFNQRSLLLTSAGIRKQDPMYVTKTHCLPRDVVKALNIARSDTAPLTRRDPVQPDFDATNVRLLQSLGYKNAYIECEDWRTMQQVFPALQDRNHPSNAILSEHWPKRKDFTPLNCTIPLEFISTLAVCACHISPDDVEHENRIAGSVSLKPGAVLRSPEYFAMNAPSERESPFKRCIGNTPLAQSLSQQLDDTLERLVRVQKASFENTVDSEIQHLLQVIAELKEQAIATEEAKAATIETLLAAQSHASTTNGELLKALQRAKLAADENALEASEALAAAAANVEFVANSFVDENVAMFNRMRKAANALANSSEDKTIPWTHETVKSICATADAPSEYMRFLSMYNPKHTSVAQETSALARGKNTSRQRRAISAVFVAIGATSQRFSLLRDAIDNVIHVPRSKHIVASSLGILPSLTTTDRHDKKLLRNYCSRINEIISGWLGLPLTLLEAELEVFLKDWNPKRCLAFWADDYVRNWNRAVYGSGEDHLFRLNFVPVAVKQGNLPPARPLSLNNDHFMDPNFLDIPNLFQVVTAEEPILDFGVESILSKCLERFARLEHFLIDRESMLTRGDSHKYSKGTQGAIDRHMGEGDVQLLNILNQQFKSYLEMLIAMMQPLQFRAVFLYLTQFIMVSPLDHPAFRGFAMLILQGDGRGNHPVGYYLGHLMFVSDPATFAKITINIPEYLQQQALLEMPPTHSLYGSEDKIERTIYCWKVNIGKAAMNFQFTIDPLHIFINACKDTARFWNDVFLGPLYQLITGSKYKEIMSMAEIEGLRDVLLAAWINVRPIVLPALQAIAHSRFDVSAFIWHMEVSVCIPVSD